MKMEEYISVLDDYYKNTVLIVEWKDRIKIKGYVDTIFESDDSNGNNDELYNEFYAASFYIRQVLFAPNNKI